MNSGITRWKIVPSYNGTPCFLACETGLVQSLVPCASPTKLATPIGACLGNKVQVRSPAVVWMMAFGPAEAVVAAAGLAAVAGFAATGLWAGADLEAGAACGRAEVVKAARETNNRNLLMKRP